LTNVQTPETQASAPTSANHTTAGATPASLGEEGLAAWEYLWALHWLIPQRHLRIVQRYCRLQDLLAVAFAQVD
jgi:hypothetical protein